MTANQKAQGDSGRRFFRRPLVPLALALGAGVALGRFLVPHPLWLACCAACGALMMLFRRNKRVLFAFFALLLFFTGAARCAYVAHPALPPEGKARVTGCVEGTVKVRQSDGRRAVYLKNAVITQADGSSQAVGRLYWTWWPAAQEEPLPLDGQTAAFTGKVYHPSGQVNPHGFDFCMYLLQRGVAAGVSGGEGLALSPENQTAPATLSLRVRQAIGDRLQALYGEEAALPKALLLGVREDLPAEVNAGFQKAGVAHILAVSGLHAMVIMGLAVWLLRRFSLSPLATLGIVGTLVAAYAVLVGGSASILRAAVLTLYMLLGRLVRRKGDGLSSLCAAFITILLLRPLDLYSAGFQMSFAAVLGIFLLGDRVRSFTRRLASPALRRVAEAYGITLSASAAVTPVTVNVYYRLSVIGLLINPIACLAAEMLLPLHIAMLVLSCVSMPAALWLAGPVMWAQGLFVGGVQALGSLPWASVGVPAIPWYWVAAIALCLMLCTRYVRLRTLWRTLLGGSALALCLLASLLSRDPAVRYIQLSVGSADAAVIRDGSNTVVIDTAEYGGDLSAYLRAEGLRVNALVLTHLHLDHAGGVMELLDDGVPIETVYISTEACKARLSPVALELLDRLQTVAEVKTLHRGDTLRWDRVSATVLWPEEGTGLADGNANDYALGLLLNLDGVAMLHMSDVEGPYEMYSAQAADVLRVAHHGSVRSTGDAFLGAVQPMQAIVSTRSCPEATAKRLANHGILVYDTNSSGAVTLRSEAGMYTIEEFLQNNDESYGIF